LNVIASKCASLIWFLLITCESWTVGTERCIFEMLFFFPGVS
jgi:hypothetical protein